MMKKIAMFGVIAAAVLSVMAFGVKQDGKALVGDTAPGFKLQDTNGNAVRLKDFEGKYVVLEWTNHQCPFVVRHYGDGNMQRQQKWAKDNGVVWLSIVSSAEGKEGYVTADQANAVMKEKGHIVKAMLLDPDGAVGKLYGAKTTPHMYVINPKGELIYMGGIDNQPRGGDASARIDYVLEALKEAMAGKEVTTKTSRP